MALIPTPCVALQRATQDSIQHQYYQVPCCRCGKSHYQQQTIVCGSINRSNGEPEVPTKEKEESKPVEQGKSKSPTNTCSCACNCNILEETVPSRDFSSQVEMAGVPRDREITACPGTASKELQCAFECPQPPPPPPPPKKCCSCEETRAAAAAGCPNVGAAPYPSGGYAGYPTGPIYPNYQMAVDDPNSRKSRKKEKVRMPPEYEDVPITPCFLREQLNAHVPCNPESMSYNMQQRYAPTNGLRTPPQCQNADPSAQYAPPQPYQQNRQAAWPAVPNPCNEPPPPPAPLLCCSCTDSSPRGPIYNAPPPPAPPPQQLPPAPCCSCTDNRRRICDADLWLEPCTCCAYGEPVLNASFSLNSGERLAGGGENLPAWHQPGCPRSDKELYSHPDYERLQRKYSIVPEKLNRKPDICLCNRKELSSVATSSSDFLLDDIILEKASMEATRSNTKEASKVSLMMTVASSRSQQNAKDRWTMSRSQSLVRPTGAAGHERKKNVVNKSSSRSTPSSLYCCNCTCNCRSCTNCRKEAKNITGVAIGISKADVGIPSEGYRSRVAETKDVSCSSRYPYDNSLWRSEGANNSTVFGETIQPLYGAINTYDDSRDRDPLSVKVEAAKSKSATGPSAYCCPCDTSRRGVPNNRMRADGHEYGSRGYGTDGPGSYRYGAHLYPYSYSGPREPEYPANRFVNDMSSTGPTHCTDGYDDGRHRQIRSISDTEVCDEMIRGIWEKEEQGEPRQNSKDNSAKYKESNSELPPLIHGVCADCLLPKEGKCCYANDHVRWLMSDAKVGTSSDKKKRSWFKKKKT